MNNLRFEQCIKNLKLYRLSKDCIWVAKTILVEFINDLITQINIQIHV